MTKIRFFDNYKVKDEEGKEYLKGKEYDMSESGALHFLRRDLAEEVVKTKKPPKPPKPPKGDPPTDN